MVLNCLSEEMPFKWKPASYMKVNHVKIWVEETAITTEQKWEWTQFFFSGMERRLEDSEHWKSCER